MGYLPNLIDRSKPTPGLDWANMMAPLISGSLSFLCSSLMVVRFVRHREKAAKKVKERLLLGLSISDMIFSSACAMSTFAGPSYLQEYIDETWTRHQVVLGTERTCNLQGWLYQAGIGAVLYSACLSIYYYLAICRRKRDRDILRCIEPTMHAIVWVWAIGSAALGLGLDLVVYVGTGGCRVSSHIEYSERCAYDPTFPECSRMFTDEQTGPWLLMSFVLPPLVVSIVVILVMMTLIYRNVSTVERRGSQWNFGNTTRRMSISSSHASNYLSNNGSGFFDTPEAPESNFLSNEKPEAPDAEPENLEGGCASSELSAVSAESGRASIGKPATNLNSQQPHPMRWSSRSWDSQPRCVPEDRKRRPSLDSQPSCVPEDRKGRRKRRKQDNRLANRVKDTGIQYILGFFFCYTITFLNISNADNDPLVMLLLGGITLPAQGIWNFVFYTKDRINGIRKRNPDQPWRQMLGEAVFGYE